LFLWILEFVIHVLLGFIKLFLHVFFKLLFTLIEHS
jgi:hypothetical protein